MLEDSDPASTVLGVLVTRKASKGGSCPPVRGYRRIDRDIRALSRAKMAAQVDATIVDGGVVHERYGAWSRCLRKGLTFQGNHAARLVPVFGQADRAPQAPS